MKIAKQDETSHRTMSYRQNYLDKMFCIQKRPKNKCPKIKGPADKTSYRQNVLQTKQPQTKCPALEKIVLRYKWLAAKASEDEITRTQDIQR